MTDADAEQDPDEDSGFEVATITIRKILTNDDTEVSVSAVDEQGEDLALVDSLGLLEFAKMALAEEHMRDEDDEDP